MENCCTQSRPEASSRPACPVCSVPASVVEAQTVKALLLEVALARFEIDAYYFCASPECDVVYFGLGGGRFQKRDLRVPVWQKEPAGGRTICYCFGENETTIRQEFGSQGVSQAVHRVRDHIAARRCACDIRNPRGTCCLGELTLVVRSIEASVRSAVPS